VEGELATKMERMRYVVTECGADMIQALVILVLGLLLLQFAMRKLRAIMDKKAKDRTRTTKIPGIVYILALVIIVSAALITVGFDSRNLLRLIIMVGLGAIVILLVLRPYFPTLPFKVTTRSSIMPHVKKKNSTSIPYRTIIKTHLNIKQWITLIICTAFCLLSVDNALSQESKEQLTGHVFYGKMLIPSSDSDLEGDDYDVSIFGADVQKPFGGGTFKYGIETGAFFSMDSDVRSFSVSSGSSGGTVAVSVDVKSLLIDYFFGVYLGFEPAKWLRLNVGAGPLLIWGERETEPEASAPEYISSESESGFGAGLYARAGIDIFLTENSGLNVGARINETTLSFKDTTGKVDIEGWQYYFGITFHF